jgi:DNA-binding Lrp family transcriptional regulator
MAGFDLYDMKILYELDLNARIPFSTLGKKIKLPKETVNYRVNKLIDNVFISNFYTIINTSLLGYRYYMAFFKFSNLDQLAENRIRQHVETNSSCFSLKILDGYYDMFFITMHNTMESLNTFVNEFLDLYGEYVAKKNIHRVLGITKINSKLFYRGETVRKSLRVTDNKPIKLDPLDMEILKILSTDSRTKLIEIAKSTGSEKSKILYRIRRLEDKGIIVSYNISTNLEKLKYFPIILLISLKNTAYIPNMIEFFDKHSVCIFAYTMLGEYDLALEIYAKSPSELRNLVKKFKNEYQKQVISTMLMTVYKDSPLNWLPV